MGLNPGHDSCVLDQGTSLYTRFVKCSAKVVYSALPARLLVDDTQAYILTYCEGGNCISTHVVISNRMWVRILVMTLVSLIKAFHFTRFVKCSSKVVYSALSARLLVVISKPTSLETVYG